MNTNVTDSVIANRYQILEQLGEGGSGITYKARDLQTSEDVAIKIISLGQVQDWKKIDLFEREAKILQQLNHPRIPKYIDYFVCDTGNNIYYQLDSNEDLKSLIEQEIEPDEFYIVQQLVRGENLATLVDKGWKSDETEVKSIAVQVLNVLIYLQQLIPPVIHRDIKPQNLIRNEKGEIFLVDFGGVQDQFRQTTVGSSVVGTYGYMSPEQLRGGKTYPSTDLYGLGATLIYLLTGEHPSELPQKRLKIDFYNLVKISANFRDWIDKLIEPNDKNRLPSAQTALDVLEGKSKLQDNLTFQSEKPSYSSIKLIKNSNKLIINIPSALNRKRYNYSLALLGVGSYAIIFLILLIVSVSIYNIYWKIFWFIYFIAIIRQVLLLNRKNRISRELRRFNLSISFILFVLCITSLSYNLYYLSVSALILVPEIIWRGFFIKLMRELLFDTVLEIQADNKIHIQQRLWFFLKQNEDIKLDNPTTIIRDDFGRLLTRGERQWLIQQITTFKKN